MQKNDVKRRDNKEILHKTKRKKKKKKKRESPWCGLKRESMRMTSMSPTTTTTPTTTKCKLSKDLFHIGWIHTTKPTTKPTTTSTSIHPIFVFSKIITFPSLWIGKNSVRFSDQFEFLFITTLINKQVFRQKQKREQGNGVKKK
jgi:hypothetical protein